MNRKQMIWRDVSFKYSLDSEALYIGNVCVGNVGYNGLKSRYVYSCSLPGMRKTGAVATKDDARQTIQNMVDAWFNEVLEA